jgi:hypothetical protein
VAKKPKGKDDSLNRLSKELQELAEPFGGWLSGHAAELPTPVTFADLEGPLLVGVGLMQRLNGAALTGWRPVQLAEALKDLAGHADLTPIVGALLLHTRFLADTGRWGGNPDDVTMSIKLLQDCFQTRTRTRPRWRPPNWPPSTRRWRRPDWRNYPWWPGCAGCWTGSTRAGR